MLYTWNGMFVNPSKIEREQSSCYSLRTCPWPNWAARWTRRASRCRRNRRKLRPLKPIRDYRSSESLEDRRRKLGLENRNGGMEGEIPTFVIRLNLVPRRNKIIFMEISPLFCLFFLPCSVVALLDSVMGSSPNETIMTFCTSISWESSYKQILHSTFKLLNCFTFWNLIPES